MIEHDQIKKLLAEGKTDLLEKFVSMRTRRAFKAYLSYDAEAGKVSFAFEPSKYPKKGGAPTTRALVKAAGKTIPGKKTPAAKKAAAKVAKDAKAKQVATKTVVVKSDSVSDALVATAKKNKVDLIVMASHGRKGIKRLLLGSETQQVLTHTTIPVLVMR